MSLENTLSKNLLQVKKDLKKPFFEIPEDVQKKIKEMGIAPTFSCKQHGLVYGNSCNECTNNQKRNVARSKAKMFSACEKMGLYEEYHGLVFGDYWQDHDGQKDALAKAKRIVNGDLTVMMMCGEKGKDGDDDNHEGFGTGKTTLAAIILHEYLKHNGKTGLYTTESRLNMEVMDAINTKQAVMPIYDKYVAIKMLVLDEVGARKLPPQAKETIGEILADRLSAGHSTVLLSNLTCKQVVGFYHNRVKSRLRANGTHVIFDWDDARDPKNKRANDMVRGIGLAK